MFENVRFSYTLYRVTIGTDELRAILGQLMLDQKQKRTEH